MSNPKPLAPLWELVEEWDKCDGAKVFGEAGALALVCCKSELAAALRAWAEQLKDVSYVGDEFDVAVEGNWVREKLLGVPAKEPAQKDSIRQPADERT